MLHGKAGPCQRATSLNMQEIHICGQCWGKTCDTRCSGPMLCKASFGVHACQAYILQLTAAAVPHITRARCKTSKPTGSWQSKWKKKPIPASSQSLQLVQVVAFKKWLYGNRGKLEGCKRSGLSQLQTLPSLSSNQQYLQQHGRSMAASPLALLQHQQFDLHKCESPEGVGRSPQQCQDRLT
jgi:hypothetical protein